LATLCALGLKARGYRVFATARTDADLKRLEAEGLEAIALDYRFLKAWKPARPRSLGARAEPLWPFQQWRLWPTGAVEDITRAVLEEQFAANFFGWHQLTTLPACR
jgi:NAD(P)-dependent dehydrogenase (short-subunit alcohol dehydrogenase family)